MARMQALYFCRLACQSPSYTMAVTSLSLTSSLKRIRRKRGLNMAFQYRYPVLESLFATPNRVMSTRVFSV